MNLPSGEMTVRPPRALNGFGHINRYWDRTNNCFAAKILPGEFYVTVHDELITTVLGSCVSACVRDRVFNIGGMNHFMLPHDSGDSRWGGRDELSESTRFGSYAMERLINEILKNGGNRRNLEVKIFGGGRILAQMTDVGERNIQFIRHYLETEGFRLVAENVGDVYPRKVIYYPMSGRVRLKKLRSLHNSTLIQREEAYLHQIETKPVAGEIDLF